MRLQAPTSHHAQGLPRAAWLAEAGPPLAGRHRRPRPTRRPRQTTGLAWVVGLAGAGGVLLTRELGLTASQLLALAHKAAGVVVLHAGGVLVLLLGPGRAPAGRAQAGARRVSALLSAAGVWVAVGLGTWSGYPRYVASPIGAGVGSARAWLLAHEPVWDGLMTLKVLTGWLAALVLTAVAAVVARHGALLGQDAGLLRLVRLLLAVGLGAAVAAAVIGVGLNAATPDQGVR